MNKKRISIVTAIVAAVVLVLWFVVYERSHYGEYAPTDDEIKLHIQLDVQEDIGLLIYDYLADGHEYSGGISNADKSLLRHDDPGIIVVWNRQQLNSSSDSVELSLLFRVITEYVDPNYENIYPEKITKYIEEPVSWTAHFGESYIITVSGDKTNGYTASLN